MPDGRFGRRHGQMGRRVAEQPLDRAQLDLVAQRRGRAVGVDIVDVRRVQPGALQRRLHGAEAAVAVRCRRGHMVGVAGQAVADHLGVNLGAPLLGVFQLFQDDDTGPLAHHETVAVLVPRPRRAGRLVVEVGRQRLGLGEAGQADAADGRLRAAGDHHVGIVECDQPRGIADGVRAGRAGGDHGMVGTLVAVADLHLAGHQIDQRAGDEVRRHPAGAALVQHDGLFLDGGQTADAGADHGAGAQLVLVRRIGPAGVLHGLLGRGDAVQDEIVDPALVLGA